LNEQLRIVDPEWDAILNRVHTGDCTRWDISELNKLVLSNGQCNLPNFNALPWSETVLVTLQNGSWIYWNEKKLEQHCRHTGHMHYVLYACNTLNHELLTLQQHLVVAGLKVGETNHLPNKVELAVSMPAMVLMNIDTDCDLVNRSCSIVVEILLDPREARAVSEPAKVRLSFPPAAILFKLFFGQNKKLPGLPPGTIPIFPSKQSFSLKGIGTKIEHKQYALMPAYAFTDYKAQGQTMESVIVDLAKLPTGSLTGFNAYVACLVAEGRPLFVSYTLLRKNCS
jgi:hypothetical protein